MAIDFPNSPTTNQTYTVGSNTWSYDGEKWVLVSQNIALDDLSNVTVPSPTNGDLIQWNGTAWVNVASSTVGATNLDGLSDVAITDPEKYQTVVYDGSGWINEYPTTVSLVNNAEATTLQVGEAVYLYGGTGNHASVKRADNDGDATSAKTVGLVAAAIPAGGNGPVVTRGYVTGIDLSTGYTAGQTLYLGEDGGFTTTKPHAPEHLVYIGVVVRATNNGIIYVAAQNGYELDEIHDVDLVTNAPVSGDFLKYNGTLWVNDQINLGTDTVGNYMSDLSAGTGISITHTPSEGSTGTVAIDTDVVPRLGVTNTFSTNQIISGSTTAALLRITQTGTGNAFAVTDSTGGDGLYINANGGIRTNNRSAEWKSWSNTASFASTFYFDRSRGTTYDSHTAVQSADALGIHYFRGSDGTGFQTAATISSLVDSTVSTGIVPGRLVFSTASSSGTLTERMRINSAGEVGIGATPVTSIGLKLGKQITGAINAYGMTSQGLVQSDVTNSAYAYYSGIGTAAASFTLSNIYHYGAIQGGFDALSTVTNQVGFYVPSSLTGATNNYAFSGNLAAATGRWNLYMGGTAANYMAGRLGVGATNTGGQMAAIVNTTAGDYALLIKGAVSQTGDLLNIQNSAGTTLVVANAAGYVGIGVASPSYKLHVSGGTASVEDIAMAVDVLGGNVGDSAGYVMRAANTNELGAIRSYVESSYLSSMRFFTAGATNTLTERMRIDSSGRVGIGTNNPSELLHISSTGSASLLIEADTDNVNESDIPTLKFSQDGGVVTAQVGINSSNNFAIQHSYNTGNIIFNTNSGSGATERMRIDSEGQVSIGAVQAATSLNISKNITGSTNAQAIRVASAVASDVTSEARYMTIVPSVDASTAAGNLVGIKVYGATLGSGASLTTQYGFWVDSGLTTGTTNYGFYGNIASATGRYNLYMNGTAANYLAGRLGVGATLTSGAMAQVTNTTAADIGLIVKGAASQSGNLQEWQNSAGSVLAYVAADGTSSFGNAADSDQAILAASIFS